MKSGDVYWVEFPVRGGHAQAGRRPAIIVQGTRASASLPTVLCVPLTTQLDALRFPGSVLVEADKKNGLQRASVALVFQLTAIDRRFLGKRLGRVSAPVLASLYRAFDDLAERAASEPEE
jgi:mRNA-degrading endonuclease toxin of MazEF toxin-antitoxin module